jgi:nucleotide-binding universal stress UspA family protein
MDTILVGFDGSADAQSALRFAIQEAKLRGAKLRVVTTWRLPSNGWDEFPPPEEVMERFREQAEETVAAARATVRMEAPDLEVETVAVEGGLGEALLDNAPEATMIVVATRGRGQIAGLLVGSVSHQVIGQSPIPVAVVPGPGSSD